MKTLVVIIAPDGRTVVRTEGFAGPECREASRTLEQALGLPISETLTAEFHQAGQLQRAESENRSG